MHMRSVELRRQCRHQLRDTVRPVQQRRQVLVQAAMQGPGRIFREQQHAFARQYLHQQLRFEYRIPDHFKLCRPVRPYQGERFVVNE